MDASKKAAILAQAQRAQATLEKVGKARIAAASYRNLTSGPDVEPDGTARLPEIRQNRGKCKKIRHATPHSAKCKVFKVDEGGEIVPVMTITESGRKVQARV